MIVPRSSRETVKISSENKNHQFRSSASDIKASLNQALFDYRIKELCKSKENQEEAQAIYAEYKELLEEVNQASLDLVNIFKDKSEIENLDIEEFDAELTEFTKILKESERKTPRNALKTLTDFLESKRLLKPLAKGVSELGEPKSPVRKIISSYGNLIALTTNIIVGVAGHNSPFAKKLADLTYRTFIFSNGILSTLLGLKDNRALFSLGHALDTGIAFTPMDKMYQLRGLSVGTYNLSNALYKSSKDVPEKGFQNLGQSFVSSLKRLKEFPVEMFNDIKGVALDTKLSFKEKIIKFATENIFNTTKASMGIIGGLAATAGALLNLAGFEGWGKILRDGFGAIAVDLERFNPKNLKGGKFFYWLSGSLFSVGTLADMAKKNRIQITADLTAKMAATQMNTEKELDPSVKNEPIPLPWEDFAAFSKIGAKKIAKMFSISSSNTKTSKNLSKKPKPQTLEEYQARFKALNHRMTRLLKSNYGQKYLQFDKAHTKKYSQGLYQASLEAAKSYVTEPNHIIKPLPQTRNETKARVTAINLAKPALNSENVVKLEAKPVRVDEVMSERQRYATISSPWEERDEVTNNTDNKVTANGRNIDDCEEKLVSNKSDRESIDTETTVINSHDQGSELEHLNIERK